jgi:scyllo-inositol 2-dehydrogenase (NADP+)
MKVIVVGLGVQGRKRLAVAGADVVATVDPAVPTAQFKSIRDVPLDTYDAALVCTPDRTKTETLEYLLSHGKHILVEKPLLADDESGLVQLRTLAGQKHVTCYTAYNHRFEPHLVRVKELLDKGTIGKVYLCRMFYGNGTAMDVKRSPWRDRGLGALTDLGSHMLDLTLFYFGKPSQEFTFWAGNRFENRAFDHVLFGSSGAPMIEFEGTMVSWRNTFTLDIFGERGSLHVFCLCKWGPSTFTLRNRILPSGRPDEQVDTIEMKDPTWALEYEHFKTLCAAGLSNIDNDIWINATLQNLARDAGEELL